MKNNLQDLRLQKIKNAKKSLGQNFLIDPAIVSKIASQLHFNENIIEIGPGVGYLTESILNKNPVSLFAIEKDEELKPILDELKLLYPSFNYNFADALSINWNEISTQEYSLISNLPYNISSVLTVNFVYNNDKIKEMVLMYQKEMADRIIAVKGSDYGRFSIMIQSVFLVKKVMDLKAGSYFPPPKVNSSVVHFLPKIDKLNLQDLQKLDKLTKLAFANRRKKVLPQLKTGYPEMPKIFLSLEISFDARAEEISLEKYLKIIKLI